LKASLIKSALIIASRCEKIFQGLDSEATATDPVEGEWVAECMAAVAVMDPAAAGINLIL
jgi:hypothetical protein